MKELKLTTKNVAHILNCGPDDVAELIRKGKLKASREPGTHPWVINLSDVKAYQRSLKGRK